MQCSLEITTHPYYAIIQDIDEVIRKRFPYGAFNQVDNVATQELSDGEIGQYYDLSRVFGPELDKVRDANIEKLANISQTMVLQDCGFCVSYALGYLKDKYPDINLQTIYLEGHQLLLIGGRISSNVKINMNDSLQQINNKIAAWGPDAIICDLWAAKSYFAREFLDEKQKDTIHFTQRNTPRGRAKEIVQVTSHYLNGNIDIYAGIASQAYDRVLIEWVKEDQRRFNLPKCTAPRMSSVINAPINAQELKSILHQLSKVDGWIYKDKNAWLHCETDAQAMRVAKSLEFTKAVVVSCGKNKQTGKPLVMCQHFDFFTLKKLANSLIMPTASHNLSNASMSFTIA